MPHPLMCIAEIPYSTAATNTQQHHLPQPGSCFYASPAAATTAPAAGTAAALGMCVLDISSGVCRLGCFTTADDPARSALAVALLMSDPAEAVAVRNNLSGATAALLKQHFEGKTAAAGPLGFGGGAGGVECSGKVSGQVPGLSLLPATAAAALSNPSGAVLERALSAEQLQQVQQMAAQAAAAAAASSSRAAGEAAGTAVLAALAVGLKQLERCSLATEVLPTLELEALTTHGASSTQPGRNGVYVVSVVLCLLVC